MRLDIHDFCLERGLSIARADRQIPGFSDEYYRSFLANLQQGSYYADFGSMRSFSRASFRSHYLKPKSHKGYLPGIRNAGATCERFFYLAQLFWLNHSYDKAIMFLGAATHLVQDLCNPFHTTHKNLREHTDYERTGMRDVAQYGVNEDGIYSFRPLEDHYADNSAFGWVDFNAHRSSKRMGILLSSSGSALTDETARILESAQRTSAGFIAFFFRSVLSNEMRTTIESEEAIITADPIHTLAVLPSR